MSKPQAHIRVDFPDGRSIGPGKVALLEWIERTGSLSASGRALGMSYRRAWLLLHAVNDTFTEPAVEFSVGGKDGGGARLTDFGRDLVATYREFEANVDALAARAFGSVKTTHTPEATPVMRGKGLSREAEVARGKRKSTRKA